MKTTISELYQFFLQTVVAKFAQDQDHFRPKGPRSLDFKPLSVLWHGGQAPQGFQVMCMESGTLGRGLWGSSCREGQEWEVKKEKDRNNNVKEIIEEDDKQGSFSDKCNKCERQATRKGYLGQHERAKHVDIQVVHMRVSTISAAAGCYNLVNHSPFPPIPFFFLTRQ